VVVAWNALGIGLLAGIVVIAVASTPALHAFGREPSALNTFVAYVPFVWLPSVLVVGAIVGHIAITRRLLAR
jgi:NADH:ubiquinone oxidoreductase subunit 6 (subunit J)